MLGAFRRSRAFAARAFAIAIGTVCFGVSVGALAEDPKALPFAVSVARVRVDVTKRGVAVVHDINLARGAFQGEDSDVFVAFGAPGAPRAIEARLLSVPRGALEAPLRERGAPLVWRYAARRPTGAVPLIGRATMAGVAIQLPGEVIGNALKTSNMVTLRLLARYAVTGAERDLVVRLGEHGGNALVLGRIEVASSDEAIERAEAHLCGDASDAKANASLALHVFGPGKLERHEPGLAPILAPRALGEDLCVRIAVSPAK